MKPLNDPQVKGAVLAATFAREIGLKHGNLWESPVARHIADDLREYTSASVEKHWRFKLGLAK